MLALRATRSLGQNFVRIKLSKMSDEAYLAASARELIEIVDKDNNVLTPVTRAEMRGQKLTHRATYAFIRTPGNYFYVQKVIISP
jgi:hypothetical protein